MAEILYHKLQFIDDNPYGDYVAGDVIDIYWDDSVEPPPAGQLPTPNSEGIKVYLNGSPITSGADIIISPIDAPKYYTATTYSPLICYTTSLVIVVRGEQAFPYAAVGSSANHPACADNGVCDLQFVGTPAVTPSAEDVFTGAISVTASSSAGPVQYRLNQNFSYGDGNGQSSGTFTQLAAGTYRIYARDSKNCSANITVVVPVTDAYGPLYRLEYDDPVGGVTRVDILQKGYGGAVTEVKGANLGFERSLKGDASQDKFKSILATEAVVHLISETDFAFRGLYTNDPDRFRINYMKLTGDSGNTPLGDLPALSTWNTTSASGSAPDWTTGATPSVTIPGVPFPGAVSSEVLYADYAFESGRTYNLSITYTRVTNSGSSNPRTARLAITDSSGTEIFVQTKATDEGSNVISISFTATDDCDRIAFSYTSGSNVTITVTNVTGTIDGFALWGVYKVLPQQYSEEYRAKPYYVDVIATDGLAGLKDFIFLKDDGQRFYESIKVIKLIAYILKKTGLNLNIRVGINLYAVGMDTTDADDPLDQAYVDCDTYYINTNDPTLDYVLRQILESFGACIIQEFGVWNIVRVEERVGEYDYREFNADGDYVGNGSYDPILDVTPVGQDGFHFVDRDHFLTASPGYGKIRVFYRLGLRENILENGDFRLTTFYNADLDEYGFSVDTFGFQLVSPDYPMTSTMEALEEGNVAWKISGNDNIVAETGNAYIQSNTYNIRMGSANSLKIAIRYKLPPPVVYSLTPVSIDIPYQKVRVRVKYGNYYLQEDSTWTTDEHTITIYATEFNKYIEAEWIALPPDGGASTGYDFDIRVYHSYIYHAEHATFNDLREVETYDDDTDTVLVPDGARTEVSALGLGEYIYYYELEENTETENEPLIIRPNDYHATDNPRQWVQKHRVLKFYIAGFTTPFWIDYVRVGFLTNGTDSLDTILREVNAEPRNPHVLEKEVTHGSYQSLVVTIPQLDFGIGKLSAQTGATLSLVTQNVLSADLVYAGYYRDEDGTGWNAWKRDGISEQSSLHAILLQQYAAQYRRSWNRLTGSFHSQSKYFNFLNVFRVVNDDNRLYLPISPSIDDKNNRVRGEFLELFDATSAAGSDGSSTSPFTSGFTSGFGSSFN